MIDDPVKAPAHYTWIPIIEPRELLGYFDGHRAAALEYIWRAGKKEGEPARRAIEKAIESLRNYLRFLEVEEGTMEPELIAREEYLQ